MHSTRSQRLNEGLSPPSAPPVSRLIAEERYDPLAGAGRRAFADRLLLSVSGVQSKTGDGAA